MRTYGIGIVGWGFMGRTHALAVRSLPLYYADADFRARIRAIATRREDVGRAAARDMDADWTADYRELLHRDDIDVVSVCTPNACHEQMALDALRAGKHLYIDKPLAVTGESAERIRWGRSRSSPPGICTPAPSTRTGPWAGSRGWRAACCSIWGATRSTW